MTDKRIQELITTVKVCDYGWKTPTASYLNNPDNFPFERCWVQIGNKHGFIKPDGTYLEVNGEELLFDSAYSFSDEFAWVRKGNKYGFIKTDGRYLEINGEELPFDDIFSFSKGFALVKIGSDKFLLSKHGLLLPNDRDLVKRLEEVILNEFPLGSIKFYIFRKIYEN